VPPHVISDADVLFCASSCAAGFLCKPLRLDALRAALLGARLFT
jgi:hypothetical protein